VYVLIINQQQQESICYPCRMILPRINLVTLYDDALANWTLMVTFSRREFKPFHFGETINKDRVPPRLDTT